MAAGKKPSFKIFILLVLLTSAALVGAVASILWISGLRLVSITTDEHGRSRFVGKVDDDGMPKSGKVYYSDGSTASLSIEGESITMTDGTVEKGKMMRLEYSDGRLYVGELSALLPDGVGSMKYAGGDLYEGDFAYGELSGRGIYYYENGDVYAGEFKGGVKHGQGSYKWIVGEGEYETYVGEFKADMRDGNGKYTYADGTIYEGEFKNDSKNGVGKLTFPDGEYYEGEFKNDLRSGKGKYVFASGDSYEGDFYLGTITGYGTYHWAEGDRPDYTGYFENNIIVTAIPDGDNDN